MEKTFRTNIRWLIIIILLVGCSPIAPTTKSQSPTQTPTMTQQLVVTDQAQASSTQVVLTGCVEEYSLRVRSDPGTQYDILGGLAVGECVTVLKRNGDADWLFVSSDDLTGWVAAEYLTVKGNIRSLSSSLDSIYEEPPVTSRSPTEIVFVTTTPSPTLGQTTNYPYCKDTIGSIGERVNCLIPRAYCSYQPGTSGSPTFCNDARYPNHNFTLLVWDKDWSDLDAKCIIVNGRLERYNGKLQIVANSRSQVSVCE